MGGPRGVPIGVFAFFIRLDGMDQLGSEKMKDMSCICCTGRFFIFG
jgi:hypothetical protein